MRNRHIVRRAFQKQTLTLAATAAAAALLGHASSAQAQVDQFVFYFSDSNAIGGFSYDAANDVFYKANFSPNQGFTKFTNSGGTYTGTQYVGPTDMTTYSQSSSLAGSGSLPSTPSGGTPTMGDMILNPATITLNRSGTNYTYNPGTIAYIVSQTGVVNSNAVAQPALTKMGFWYDLRRATPATATAVGPDRNSNGLSDWNDVFENSFSLADMQAVQGSTATTGINMARRFAFSSDGQAIYFNESGASYGGIWKVTLTGTPVVTKPVSSLTGTRINTEPGVLASSVRNLGGGSGDQVMFQGSTDNGNIGGVNYVVDNGTTVSSVKTLLTAKQLSSFLDIAGATADVGGITSDSDGNIYLYNGQSNAQAVYMYDTQGRIAKVASDAEHRVFQATKGTAFQSTMLDTKVRPAVVTLTGGGTATLQQVMYSDSATTLRAPVGITVYKPGDFNRDNVVDASDVTLFKTKLGLRGVVVASIGTATPFTQTNTANLKFDLNGSNTVSSVAGVAIDWKDVKIFQQFAGLSAGDVNMDFSVDNTDLTTLGASYNGANNKLFTDGNLTSVRIDAIDKDTVNFADLVTLAASWTGSKPALAAVGNISQTDIDRAFAITANGTISEYVAKGSGTWSNTAAWSNGVVPNAAGAVASLLTKPFDDVTLDVDGSYTVGQLNFDNYFSYTLSGAGTLHFAGTNGSRAEINAFAASPTISAAVAVDTSTDATVTYAADTLTLGGVLRIGGGEKLTKLGPGKLVISGTQLHDVNSALAVNAGTLDLNTDAGPGNARKLTINVANGATINFNSAQHIRDVNNNGFVNVTTGGSVADAINGTGSMTIAAGDPSISATHVRQGMVTINSGTVTVLADGTDAGTSKITTLSIAGGVSAAGALDLNDNDLVTSTGKTTIESLVKNARNGGAWNGKGITSTAARNNSVTGLGVLSGAEYTSVGGTATFSGQAYAAGDTLVKYTWNGDANFDGRVTFDDYVKIDTGFNTGLTGWLNGDFNYSGAVTFDDYVLIDIAFNQQNGTLSRAIDWISGDDRSAADLGTAGLSEVLGHLDQFGSAYGAAFLAAVPEPTSLALLGVPALAGIVRRRRRSK